MLATKWLGLEGLEGLDALEGLEGGMEIRR